MKKIFGWVAASAFVVLGASQDVFAGGWTQLPRSGLGFKTHSSPDRQWGQARLVNNLVGLGQNWNFSHGGRHLSFGDMSRYGGGYFPPHQTHRDGRAGDFLPWGSYYNTQRFVNLMYSAGSISFILYNGGQRGVRWAYGHGDHLHMAIY